MSQEAGVWEPGDLASGSDLAMTLPRDLGQATSPPWGFGRAGILTPQAPTLRTEN